MTEPNEIRAIRAGGVSACPNCGLELPQPDHETSDVWGWPLVKCPFMKPGMVIVSSGLDEVTIDGLPS